MQSTVQTEEVETPRKRKRESDKCIFTNAAFSSTPKKPIVAARRLPKPQPAPRTTKENANPNPFFVNAGLEVKSIAESASQQSQKTEAVILNPFEVVRKPPKKKKRDEEIKESCFENPALNLDIPEKQFNPYEVVRTPVVPQQQCFINEALNLRSQDVSAARNPFEIHRANAVDCVNTPKNSNEGVTNLALEEVVAPTKLQIGLPFTPTLGCRIDFKNISLSQLTPSRLLADKLIFSPVPAPSKRSLDAISETSTTLDIGKELDRYQLELENSINEAKMRRNGNGDILVARDIILSPELVVQTAKIDQKLTFTQKLAEIVEGEENEEAEEENKEHSQLHTIESEKTVQLEVIQEETEIKVSAELKPNNEKLTSQEEANGDVAYASESEEEDEDFAFKAPSRFVRAYRREDDATRKLTVSKESLNSVKSHKSNASSEDVDEEQHKKSKNVKNMIRRSIRKLMHPLQSNESKSSTEQPQEKHHNNVATNMINTLRHSLRRKPGKQLLVEDEATIIDAGKATTANISIIDSSERTMKLKSQMPQMEYARIEELTNERKHSLRNSLRHSTRGMRDQLMRTVFHKKHEEYAFCK